MEAKHTKGKWEYKVIESKSKTKITVQIPATEYESKTELILGYLGEDDCQDVSCCKTTEHSNAKLIASAPLLLSDLCDLVWLIESGATQEELEERIKTSKQLISKITE